MLKKLSLFGILFTFISLNSFCQKQPYLDGMPKAVDVIKNIKGANPKDTYAKQVGALNILWSMIHNNKMDKYHIADTKKETALLNEYNRAMGQLRNGYSVTIKPLNSEANIAEYNRLWLSYEGDKNLEAYLVNNLFNDLARKQYNRMRIYNENKQQQYTAQVQGDYQAQLDREKVEEADNPKQQLYEIHKFFGLVLGGVLIIPLIIFIQSRRKPRILAKSNNFMA